MEQSTKKNTDENEPVDGHPGFVNAIKLEFFENEKDLIYESEKLLMKFNQLT